MSIYIDMPIAGLLPNLRTHVGSVSSRARYDIIRSTSTWYGKNRFFYRLSHCNHSSLIEYQTAYSHVTRLYDSLKRFHRDLKEIGNKIINISFTRKTAKYDLPLSFWEYYSLLEEIRFGIFQCANIWTS